MKKIILISLVFLLTFSFAAQAGPVTEFIELLLETGNTLKVRTAGITALNGAPQIGDDGMGADQNQISSVTVAVDLNPPVDTGIASVQDMVAEFNQNDGISTDESTGTAHSGIKIVEFFKNVGESFGICTK